MRLMVAAVLVVVGCLPAGCGSGQGAQPCENAGQCAPAGDALCIRGRCSVFAPDEYAALVVNISFPRDTNPLPASGEVWVMYPDSSDGRTIDCQQLRQSAEGLGNDDTLNPLLAQPRYLVFNCCGTYFPDNLVQLVRPAEQALVLGLAFRQLQAQGDVLAWGCERVEQLRAGSQPELTLAMQAWE